VLGKYFLTLGLPKLIIISHLHANRVESSSSLTATAVMIKGRTHIHTHIFNLISDCKIAHCTVFDKLTSARCPFIVAFRMRAFHARKCTCIRTGTYVNHYSLPVDNPHFPHRFALPSSERASLAPSQATSPPLSSSSHTSQTRAIRGKLAGRFKFVSWNERLTEQWRRARCFGKGTVARGIMIA
jgi:hypothetical protein